MKITHEKSLTKQEARSLARAAGKRLPRPGNIVRIERTLNDHHFGLADFILYRQCGQWRQAFVINY